MECGVARFVACKPLLEFWWSTICGPSATMCGTGCFVSSSVPWVLRMDVDGFEINLDGWERWHCCNKLCAQCTVTGNVHKFVWTTSHHGEDLCSEKRVDTMMVWLSLVYRTPPSHQKRSGSSDVYILTSANKSSRKNYVLALLPLLPCTSGAAGE